MTKGERIKELRINKGMTQEELATACKTTKQTINKYEKGIITNIPSDKIELLCDALGTDPSYIFDWADSKKSKLETLAKNLTDDEIMEVIQYIGYLISKR